MGDEHGFKYSSIPYPLLKTWLRLSLEADQLAVKQRYSGYLIEEFGDLDVAYEVINGYEGSLCERNIASKSSKIAESLVI
ncbi:hypothetical protein KIH87_14095 [Paraneptunicella aestuarii]|uniref:hypothetical protein n=1 Tax=Paraneptunicella aestuarii TaxID=2831148 RepID=UPI001E38EE0A|nr:hypothetical protein [Paraneptunicella aestuarii]UAA37824.1 hypothetical protein KIH87_14095 [Paraneptunicella aestuarii]